MLISYYTNKKSSPRLPSWQPSLISFNTPIDSGSIIKPCTLKHFQVPILAPGLYGVFYQIWLYEILGGKLLIWQNSTVRVCGAWIRIYHVLCSKIYSTLWGYSAVRLAWHGSVRQRENRCRTPRTSGSVVPVRQHEWPSCLWGVQVLLVWRPLVSLWWPLVSYATVLYFHLKSL